MALSVAQWAQVSDWFNRQATGTTKTITGVSWSSGDTIVVITGAEAHFVSDVIPTNANLTFGAEKAGSDNTASEAQCWLYATTATSSQSSQTITLTSTLVSGPLAFGGAVWVITGGPTGTANATWNYTEANISRTVTKGSVIIYGLMDFNATNPPGKTPATGSGTPTERLDQGDGVSYGQWLADWVDTANGTFSFGPNNYTSLQTTQIIIEVTAANPVTVTAEGTGNSATSTATLAFDCGDSFAVGDILCVCISADNNGTAGVSSLTSVADAGGNTYELLQATYDPVGAAAGQTVGIAWAKITTALVTTDDVTISFSPNTTSKAAVVWKLHPDDGITLQKVTSGFTAGSATGSPTVTTSTITINDVVIGAFAAESNAAVTLDSDTTNGVWSPQATAVGNTGTSGTSSRVASQNKIVTATATQTYNLSITSCDNILGWITFTPAFIRPQIQVRPSTAVHQSRNW